MKPGQVGTPCFPPLRCPVDGGPLEARGEGFDCANSHRFGITRGIPRLVHGDGHYTDAFGEQWNNHRVTQLDSYTQSSITRDRMRRCLGDDLWASLAGPGGAIEVLETGCGAGRFTEVLLSLESARVTSTDLSSAVDANQTNFPQTDRHRVIQCDIFSLPFVRGSYDVVLCLGVIQHTPDPEAAIGALYRQVKPGGWLVIDHYRKSLAHYTKFTAIALRPLLKRLPPAAGSAATEWLTRVFFPLHRAVKRRPALQMLLSRVSPLLTYYHTYPQLDDRLQYEWAVLDTHDALTDFYKHLRTEAQIAATLRGLGAESTWVARGGNGVEARCRKPAGA